MIIYKATNKNTGKTYIGQTVYSLENRRSRHIYEALIRKDTCYFHNAIRKYGIENFDWKIIIEGVYFSKTLNELEIYFIKLYNTYNNGYNLNIGGNGNSGYRYSKASKEKLSKASKGEKHPMYGKHHTMETKEKMSKARKGMVFSESHKRKIAETQKGKNNSMYGQCGKNNPFYGKKHTSEDIEKMSIPVIINNKRFDSLKNAAVCLGITYGALFMRLKRKSTGYYYA